MSADLVRSRFVRRRSPRVHRSIRAARSRFTHSRYASCFREVPTGGCQICQRHCLPRGAKTNNNLAMENYTSDSSDSDSVIRWNLSHQLLDNEVLDKKFLNTKHPEQVDTLLLSHNSLMTLPASINRFNNLNSLDISNCGLIRLPDFWIHCPLTCLIAKHNNLTNDGLAKDFENLANLRELNLSGNSFTEFPEQILDLPGLRYLYLGGNHINEITKDIWKLQSLRVLSMGDNRLTEVPSTLGELKALQALVLCDNMLESLPSSIANLTNLKTLSLHKNRLRTLPTEIITLKCLTELSLRDNPLVVRFVSDMTHNPPSLLEVAARVIKNSDIRYDNESIPHNLVQYLNSAHHCVNPQCKGVYFNNRIEHIKFVDFCGKYRLPLLQYLCSSKCIEPRGSNEELVSGAMIRKVLLG